MSEERKFKIISIPDEITLNKNNIYEFEIIPSDEFLTKEEYEGIPIRLVSLQKVEQLEKENEKLNNIIDELENTIANFIENHTESYIDWKYDREIYLAESNILQKLFDTYLDKLKELKENNKDV